MESDASFSAQKCVFECYYVEVMNPFLEQHADAITKLCVKHHVQRLFVFGSAARDDFDPSRSDLDFVVEFEPLSPSGQADAYFSLLKGLEMILGRSIDLITDKSIANPHFRKSVDEYKLPVYAAA